MTKIELIDANKINIAVIKALEKIYVKELTLRTPKRTGFTSSQWFARDDGDFIYSLVNPKGNIIQWLEEGTQAHPIVPKNKKMLKFPNKDDEGNWVEPTFRNPEELKSFRKNGKLFFFNRHRQAVLGFTKEGSRYFVFARKVNHPGFEGRYFIEKILRDESLYAQFKQELSRLL